VIGSETFKKSLESSPDLVERISHVLAERQALLEEQASIRADGGGDGAVVAERGAQLLSRIRGFFRL
jgi:CRP-like cAMP-binding protein